MTDWNQVDMGVLSEYRMIPHTDQIARRTTDIASTPIKQENQKDQAIARDPKVTGETMLRMSYEDLKALKRLYPDLASPDREIRTEAWQKFARNPISFPFHRTRTPGQNRIFLP